MKIVFDGYWLVSGPPSQRHVVRETILMWQQEYPSDSIIVVVPHRDKAEASRLLGPSARVVGTRAWPQAAVASLVVPLVAVRHRTDAVHVQNFAAPYKRSAVFIHDVLFCEHPEWFTRAEQFYFKAMPILAPLADVVLSSTATEGERIRRNSRSKRVVPVGLGTPLELLGAHSVRPPGVIGLDQFYLTVGRLNVRKNLDFTARAFNAAGLLSPETPLVVVGESNGKASEFSCEAQELIAEGKIVMPGHVSDAELKWLYENAVLFAFLTLGEGYGMPPVEAAVLGCPTVVSDLPVFHENLGEQVAYANPQDLAAAAAALRNAEARGRSPEVSPVSWRDVVSKTRAALEESRRSD